MSERLATAYVEVTSKSDALFRGIKNMKARVGREIQAVSNMVAVGLGVATAAAAMFAKTSTDRFESFEKGMQEVFTLLPGYSQDAKKKMVADVKELALEMGVLPQKIVPALYQALSAGVPAETVFDFMRTAQKVAIGGVSDLDTAVDGLTNTVNAYGSDVLSAQHASDLLFTTIRLGKTTFNEMAAYLFQVAPNAAAAGVGFEQVAAAMAAITAQGTPTRVAATRIRALLDELGKAGGETSKKFEKLAGVGFRQFIASGKTLHDALQIMRQEAEKSGQVIGDMFGSVEAAGAANMLAGKQAEKFASNLEAMKDAAGATDAAYQQMAQGVAFVRQHFKAAADVIRIEFGQTLSNVLVPTLMRLGLMLKSAARWMGDLTDEQKKSIAEAISLASAIAGVASSLMLASRAARMFGTTLARVLIGATGFGIILVALGAIVLAIKDLVEWLWKSKTVQDALAENAWKFKQAWENIKAGMIAYWDALVVAAGKAFQAIAGLFGIEIDNMSQSVEEFVGDAISKIADFALNASEWFRVIFENLDIVWRLVRARLQYQLYWMADRVREFAQNMPVFFRAMWAALIAGGEQWLEDMKNKLIIAAALWAKLASWMVKNLGPLMQNALVKVTQLMFDVIKKSIESIMTFMIKTFEVMAALRKKILSGMLNPAKAGAEAVAMMQAIGDKMGEGIAKLTIPIKEKMGQDLDELLTEQIKLRSGVNVAKAMADAFNKEVNAGWKDYESERTKSAREEARAAAEELVKHKRELEGKRGPSGDGDMGTPLWWEMTKTMMKPQAGGAEEGGGPLWWEMTKSMLPKQGKKGAQSDIKPGVVGFADLNRQIQMSMLKDKTAENQRAQIVEATKANAEFTKQVAQNTKPKADQGGLAGGPAA